MDRPAISSQGTTAGAVELQQLHYAPRVEAQYLTALEKLEEQLNETWKHVFPSDARWPRETCEAFFGPFAQLGVALYDAYAQELLNSTLSREQYLQALNVELKTLVCDRIHLYREKPIRTLRDARDADARGELEDEWTVRMRQGWRLFEHPRHSAAHDRVRREFIEIADADVWMRLIDRVHTAISKRTTHWMKARAERVAELAEVGTTVPPATRGDQRRMGGSRCDPLLWRRFNHERTSQKSNFRDLLIYSFVSLTVPAGRTSRDVAEQIAREAGIPVESLSGDLNQPVYTRGQVIFGFAGDQFDKIACDHDNLQWWVSDTGLNMAIVSPAEPVPSIPTFDELMRAQEIQVPKENHKRKKPARRNQRYGKIDRALKEIAESQPRTQEKIFKLLDERGVAIPPAEPFETAHGWMSGFRRNNPTARVWLSKRWKELGLPPLYRGPKKPTK